jgi:hypothetical protein
MLDRIITKYHPIIVWSNKDHDDAAARLTTKRELVYLVWLGKASLHDQSVVRRLICGDRVESQDAWDRTFSIWVTQVESAVNMIEDYLKGESE